jgi:HSP20 family protein
VANIIKKNQGGREVAGIPTTPGSMLDPFRLMRELLRWDPLRELDMGLGIERPFVPSFDVKETKDAYVFRADLPGVKDEDVEISVTGNRLTISGHREQERENEGDQYYARESSYGNFVRSFTMPDGCDAEAVKAELRNGVLVVSVPKKPEMQAKRIPIGKSAGGPSGGGGEKKP